MHEGAHCAIPHHTLSLIVLIMEKVITLHIWKVINPQVNVVVVIAIVHTKIY